MVALLTTLERVKAWAGLTGTANDVQITGIIRSVSAFVASILPNVALEYGAVTETYDGGGHTFMLLRQKPVVSVQSIAYCGQSITTPSVGNPRSNGFILEGIQPPGIPQRLDLFGYCYPYGRANVDVAYTAGYVNTAEAQVIPASPYQITTYDVWTADLGVTLANGTALVKVASGPVTGQYSVDANGIYTFAAADIGKAVLITYAYVPGDIAEAVTEMIAERQKAGGQRVGVSGMTTGRESVTYYSKTDMNAWAASALQSYITTIPV